MLSTLCLKIIKRNYTQIQTLTCNDKIKFPLLIQVKNLVVTSSNENRTLCEDKKQQRKAMICRAKDESKINHIFYRIKQDELKYFISIGTSKKWEKC